MKKILLTIAFVIIVTINASAQYKPFQFGLKVEPGVAWTKLNSDHLYDGKTKMSFNWGFISNVYFVENYGLATGFNMKFMNNEYSFKTKDEVDVTRTIKNQYLEIPIGLIMRTEKMGNIRILGNVSYSLGFLLNNNEKNFVYQHEAAIENDIHEYSKLRHAFIVKLGAEYYIHKSSSIIAALVFNNNFANIYKANYEHHVLLNNLCLEIGFMF